MPSSNNVRIGIFGGAFDPPHRGHETALRAFLRLVAPDLVYVIPSGRAPHKALSGKVSAADRLAMARLAFEALDERVFVSDLEIRSEGVSYTYLTLRALKEKHPDGEFFLFLGTDQLLQLESWRNLPELMENATLCVMDRFDGDAALTEKIAALEKEFNARFLLLQEKAYIISSTAVREELAETGVSLAVSPAVHDYITLNGLYRKNESRLARALSYLKENLPTERLTHSLSVAREVMRLALLTEEQEREELYLAALLHDLTRRKNSEEQKEILSRYGEEPTPEDLACPVVLHGKTAALIAADEFSLSPYAADAIACHTTGRCGMSLADEILFFADYIEETRPHEACRRAAKAFYDDLPATPEAVREHLAQSVSAAMQAILSHLEEEGKTVHPQSRLCLEERTKNGKEKL